MGDQDRQGHSVRDQDRRDHPARNPDKRDYVVRNPADRRDYPVRDQERQDHSRDRGRQEFPTKGRDYPVKEKEAQDNPTREHGRQNKYQGRRDQQEEFAAREQDRQSKRRGQDPPQPARDRQVYSPREREQQEMSGHVAREDSLAAREPDVQEHHPPPRQREWHNARERQDDRSGARPRGDRRGGPRAQEGREHDERKPIQGQKQEKVENLSQEMVDQYQILPTTTDEIAAFEEGKNITEKNIDATPSNVQAPEPRHGTVDDGSQRRGYDNQRNRQWSGRNKESRKQGGQVGPRQRGDSQRYDYGERRQRGNWERDTAQTSSQSAAELDVSQRTLPTAAPASKDASLEPRTPIESSGSLRGIAEGVSRPPLGPATKQERAKWDQRPPRDDVSGGRQNQRRHDQRESRQPPRYENAGGQLLFKGKDALVAAEDKHPVGELTLENKNQSLTDADKRQVEEQKSLRESREAFSRRPAKGARGGGGGARGRRFAGHERVQQPRDNVTPSSDLEARSKNSPNPELGYSQLEDIDSSLDFSDLDEEPASSNEKVQQQDQTKPPQGSQAYNKADQYRLQRSFRGSRHRGGLGRGRGHLRNEGERRDRHRSADVVGMGAREHIQVATETAATTDEEPSLKSSSSKEVKLATTDKKEASTGPKSDLSLYDLHSHKVVIVDDNMKEVEDDRDGSNNGAFVEVTSKRTQKEKQKKEREEQQREEEVGRHRDEDKHRNKGHKSRSANGGGIQAQAPRMAWMKTELEEPPTVGAWGGANDPSTVNVVSNSSSSWITNSLPSNAAPGAELKMANQRTDAVPSSSTTVTRTTQPPPTSYVGKDSANTGNSGSSGGGFTPFSSPFQLTLLSAAVDQSMSSGHDVLPSPSSEKPLAPAKVFAGSTQDEPKGSSSAQEVVGRGGAVGHGKNVATHVPPRFQSSGRGANRGRKESTKVREVCLDPGVFRKTRSLPPFIFSPILPGNRNGQFMFHLLEGIPTNSKQSQPATADSKQQLLAVDSPR